MHGGTARRPPLTTIRLACQAYEHRSVVSTAAARASADARSRARKISDEIVAPAARQIANGDERVDGFPRDVFDALAAPHVAQARLTGAQDHQFGGQQLVSRRRAQSLDALVEHFRRMSAEQPHGLSDSGEGRARVARGRTTTEIGEVHARLTDAEGRRTDAAAVFATGFFAGAFLAEVALGVSSASALAA